MKTLSNTRGSIFILVLITAGVIGLIAIAITSQLVNFSKNQSQVVTRNNHNELITKLRNAVQDPATCLQMFGGLSFNSPTTFPTAPRAITITTRLNNSTFNLSQTSGLPYLGLTFEKVEARFVALETYITPNGAVAPRTVHYHYAAPASPGGVVPLTKALYNIKIKPQGIAFNDNSPELLIPIYVKGNIVGTSLRVVGCHGLNSIAQACEITGGAYDTQLSPLGLMCNPDLVCHNHNQGVFTCNSQNCPSPYNKVHLGVTQCICQWCNQHRRI